MLLLYQLKNSSQNRLPSSSEPKRLGKRGLYVSVLLIDSEYGLSSLRCGRLCDCARPRPSSNENGVLIEERPNGQRFAIRSEADGSATILYELERRWDPTPDDTKGKD